MSPIVAHRSAHSTTFHQAALEQGIELGSLDVAPSLGKLDTAGARPFRADRWNVYDRANGKSQYQVAAGDTLSGLAALYLDNSGRWAEIWNLQQADRTVGFSPDQIYTDEWLEMPTEAMENALILNGGNPLPGMSGGGGGNGKTGAKTNGNGNGGMSTGTKIAIGAAALAALGVGGYFLLR